MSGATSATELIEAGAMATAGSIAAGNPGHAKRRGALAGLALAAMGVVFGDIGTSPLYSLQTVFSADHNRVQPNPVDVYGVISMVFWTLTIIVSYGYAFLMMRADNDGEGGILSLVALLRRTLHSKPKMVSAAMLMGVLGASLFFGDAMITPAISVMSAIEGLAVVSPSMTTWVVPGALVILTGLFLGQRYGTQAVGRLFGPVMTLWFVTLAVLGIPHIIDNPAILRAISPQYAIAFGVERPFIAFIAMGAVVLTITGVEALYADMGHFGKKPIRLAWFGLVFPCLVLCYMGMGAMILKHPSYVDNPFFHLAPNWARVPLVVLATAATVIASQAVISGAFSVSRQAMYSGLLPRLHIKQTSKEEGGQIYVAAVNWILFAGVSALIIIFESSSNLANAYGLAVTGTLLLEMTIFLFLAHNVWRVHWWKVVAAVILVLGLEFTFLTANIAKILHGGWLPLLIASIAVTVMLTWKRGSESVHDRRRNAEGQLSDFIARVHHTGIPRVPGTAVYPHPNNETTPLALRQNVEFNHVLHEHIVIVTVVNENVPHIRHVDRATVDELGYQDDGIVHVVYRVGFNDSQNVPAALRWAKGKGHIEMDLDPEEARYFISSLRLTRADVPTLARWRRVLFFWLNERAASRTSSFSLPPERTVTMGGQVAL